LLLRCAEKIGKKHAGLAAALCTEPLCGSAGIRRNNRNYWKLVQALRFNAGKGLEQMPNKLENSRGSVIAHAIDTKITMLAMTTKPDLDEGMRMPPKGGMSGNPLLAVFALVTNAEMAGFYAGGHV